MKMNFKEIHIGKLIHQRVEEFQIEKTRITNYFNCSIDEVEKMYQKDSLDSDSLLKWCKLLEYDFFRVYTQHLILYAPPSADKEGHEKPKETALPQFRKNIYTKEVIDFIVELVETGEKTKKQIIEEYRIPKTTLYKWMDKYKN